MKRGFGSISHPRQPLLWAAAAYAAGIVAGQYLWRPALWWLLAAALFALSASFFVRRRTLAAYTLAVLTLFVGGASTIQWSRAKTPVGSEILRFADATSTELTAHVVREGTSLPDGYGGIRQALDIETEQITRDAETKQLRSRLRLSIYFKEDSGARIFLYGERLQLLAKLFPPRNFRNPGAFDYRGYLAEQGIAATGSAKAEDVKVLPGFFGNRAEFWRNRIHSSVIRQIHALWSGPEAALIDAMVIGDDNLLDRSTRMSFQKSGTYHLLVVSGMNVSILAFACFWLLRRLRASELVASIVTILATVGYALLTNVGPPIWRATLMMAIYLVTRLLYRDRAALNAIGGAALGLMILDPRVVLGASFQLTFLAVLIIAGIAAPFLERTSQPYLSGLRHFDSLTFDAQLPPRVAQFRLDLRLLSEKLAQFLGRSPLRLFIISTRVTLVALEVLAVSALMQIGLALPMSYYFHRATVVGLPANIVVVPVTGILMPAVACAVALSYLSLTVARIPALISGVCLKIIVGAVHGLSALRVADTRVPMPGIAMIIAAGVAIALAMLLSRRRALYAAAGIAALAATAAWICLLPPPARLEPKLVELTSIDVGEGDSLLLVTPQGKTILIDAGGPIGGHHTDFDIGEEVVSPYLWWRDISHLDAVVVTHGHSDHMGGMPAILNNFHPRELWIGAIPQSAEFSSLLNLANERGTRVMQFAIGDQFNFGGVHARVLSPPRDWVAAEPRNNDSLVIEFRYQDSSLLMEGDAEKRMERAMVPDAAPVTVLKVAHHGSSTSSIPELLAALRPQYAVISVGARNPFGLPRAEVLERLGDSHVRTYRTDMDGAVTLYLDGTNHATPASGLR